MKQENGMRLEKSCGDVIACRDGEQDRILLIRHRNGGHWAFPKGHVEKDETEEQTARREILEETGLQDITLDTNFRYVNTFSPKPGVMKDVVYFAARTASSDVTVQQEEVLDYAWDTPEDALERVTYANDRLLVEAYLAYMNGNH